MPCFADVNGSIWMRRDKIVNCHRYAETKGHRLRHRYNL